MDEIKKNSNLTFGMIRQQQAGLRRGSNQLPGTAVVGVYDDKRESGSFFGWLLSLCGVSTRCHCTASTAVGVMTSQLFIYLVESIVTRCR